MTDYQIIEGLKSENDKLRNQAGKALLEKTYSQIFAIAERKRETALELFRESYLALMLQIEKEGWQLRSSLLAWFCQTARFIFWKIRKDNKKMELVDWEKVENSERVSSDLKIGLESEMSEYELDFMLRQQAWESLGDECKKLLLEKNQHLINKQKTKSTWQELTKLFGGNEGTLKKRAFDCREKLQRLLEDLKKKN